MFDLTGRCALVTGSGQGVGAGIAATLAAQGAAVAVNDIIAERAEAVVEHIRVAGGSAIAVVADVTNRAAIDDAIARVAATHGPVDVLVNNAGIPLGRFPVLPFRELDPATWDDVLQLNIYGVLNVTHAVIGGMCDRGWGRVVNISSEAGRMGIGADAGCTVYGAAKGAVVSFSRNLAPEVIEFGVTVNCVSLSLMEGNWAPPVPADGTWKQRLGKPADAGAAVAYLASDEAGWVTGQTLPVNGGYATS